MNGRHSNGCSRSPVSSQTLPLEIICEIVSYITSQSALHSTASISSRYNIAATPLLYKHPKLSSANFEFFVRTVAPTVFPPPKRYLNSAEYHLATLVQTLDLSHTTYNETLRSSIARLLTHCRSLTTLIGPQKSFNGVALRALRHCAKLEYLDLRPGQETCDLADFFHVLTHLSKLTVLHFPLSALFSSGARHSRLQNTIDAAIVGAFFSDSTLQITIDPNTSPLPTTLKTTFTYPPNLTTLSVSGGLIDSTFLASGTPPPTITSFSASHLPFVRMTAIRQYLNMLSPQLTHLSILHPIPRLPHNFLDRILFTCPNLLHLTASVDFLTAHIFDEENCVADHPIERIDLDCSGGMGSEFKVSSDDISIALMEGRLKRLRVVRASVKLGWGKRGEEMRRVKDLAELLCMDRTGFGEDEEEDAEDEDVEGNGVIAGQIEAKEPVGELVGREKSEDGIDDITGKLAGVWLF
ncbi:hypothetical protein ABW20_dc0104273 [Dactylellina cionopaga]|nr:hypothetical protein ABW20_dc0104273 [Dactylellina cionopaga]